MMLFGIISPGQLELGPTEQAKISANHDYTVPNDLKLQSIRPERALTTIARLPKPKMTLNSCSQGQKDWSLETPVIETTGTYQELDCTVRQGSGTAH